MKCWSFEIEIEGRKGTNKGSKTVKCVILKEDLQTLTLILMKKERGRKGDELGNFG